MQGAYFPGRKGMGIPSIKRMGTRDAQFWGCPKCNDTGRDFWGAWPDWCSWIRRMLKFRQPKMPCHLIFMNHPLTSPWKQLCFFMTRQHLKQMMTSRCYGLRRVQLWWDQNQRVMVSWSRILLMDYLELIQEEYDTQRSTTQQSPSTHNSCWSIEKQEKVTGLRRR